MPDAHAKLFSPSKAEGWFACAGRAVMEAPFPDTSGPDADNGTARHEVCALCLLDTEPGRQVTPLAFVGRVMSNRVAYRAEWVEEDQDYVDTFRRMAEGGEMFVEQRLDFRRFIECTADDDGFGTGDVVILKPLADGTYELIVGDRKTGYHEVPVERNKQLLLYALGAYDEHSLVYDISRVRLMIHQRSAREWDCSVEELLQFGQEARSRAITVYNAVQMHGKVDQAEWEQTFLNQNPSEDACKYCRAMAACPSMTRKVQNAVGTDFATMADEQWSPGVDGAAPDYLSTAMAAAGLIEDWLKAVRGEVERRLLAGQQVPGFGLELGRQGARVWKDKAEAEKTLKSMRLTKEQMYDFEVISPTSAEKLAPKYDKDGKLKPDQPETPLGHRQWQKLQDHITRAPGKPSVKPISLIKAPYTPPAAASADDFAPVDTETTDLA